MSATKILATKRTVRAAPRMLSARQLGIDTNDPVKVVRSVRAGFPFKRLTRFQKTTQLPWTEISRFVDISPRTLSRRQSSGRLRPDESDRILRASNVFALAVRLFEGDRTAARKWLQTPQPGLGGEKPLDFASTEVGAREVEHLIGRLEHGVFT